MGAYRLLYQYSSTSPKINSLTDIDLRDKKAIEQFQIKMEKHTQHILKKNYHQTNFSETSANTQYEQQKKATIKTTKSMDGHPNT